MKKMQYTNDPVWEKDDIGRTVQILTPNWYVTGYIHRHGEYGVVQCLDHEEWSAEVLFSDDYRHWYFARECVLQLQNTLGI